MDITAPQPADLTPTQPGTRHQQHDQPVPRRPARPQQRNDLLISGPVHLPVRFMHPMPGPHPPTHPGLRAGKALADVATIGLLQQRAIRSRDTLTDQLQTALNSRVLIEQAKGVLAERLQLDLDQAFALLRRAARNRNRRLSELAQAVVDSTEDIPANPEAGSAH